MRIIFSELWSSLKKSKLNNKWIKGITLVVLLLTIALGVKILLFPAVEKGEVANSLNEDWKEEARLIDKIKNGEEVDDNGEYSDEIETTIKLFFVASNERSLDLFSTTIDGEIITRDFILKYDTSDLMSKYNEAMDRISRNGRIESVEILGSTIMIGTSKRRVVVGIKYLDLDEPIRVGLEIDTFKSEEHHGEDAFSLPLISQSIWEIIEIIEKGAI